MADIAVQTEAYRDRGAPRLDHKTSPISAVFFFLLAAGIGYGMHGLLDDIESVYEPLALGVFALLGLALLIALGFEFVNGARWQQGTQRLQRQLGERHGTSSGSG